MKTKPCYSFILFAALAITFSAQSQTADALINKLIQKGILTEKEAQEVKSETVSTNLVGASKWRINDDIKSINLFGDKTSLIPTKERLDTDTVSEYRTLPQIIVTQPTVGPAALRVCAYTSCFIVVDRRNRLT